MWLLLLWLLLWVRVVWPPRCVWLLVSQVVVPPCVWLW